MNRILTFIAVLLLGINAFTQTTVKLLSQTDSSSVAGAKVEINFENTFNKILRGESDLKGVVLFNISAPEGFFLLVTKDGFKPFFGGFSSVPKEIVLYLKPLSFDGEEVTVSATRAGDVAVGTFTQLSKKDLAQRNFGQDLPILLQNIPSAVSTTDAGAGIGYTGLRIRGIDPTRINVTVNGVPLNDAESQGVFWVNMPDFASGVENIQVQRGVGTSSFGSASFGASINIKTDNFSENPYVITSLSTGSFNTNRQSLKFGTGRMKHDWFLEGRVSRIVSNGFIDRASSNLNSWFFNAGKKTAKSLLQLNVFSGNEKTYQAWNGVPMEKYMKDSAGLEEFILLQGYDSLKASQLRNSNPYTFNYYTYPNETDNYTQSHIQLIYNRQLSNNANLNSVLHGTLGKGFFENFEYKTDLSGFMSTPLIVKGDSIYYANLIHQRWLDNTFGGIIVNYHLKKARWQYLTGASFNLYAGKHFGKVVWHEYNELNTSFRYYDNKSLKTNSETFFKFKYRYNVYLDLFADLALRHVFYSWYGPFEQSEVKQQQKNYLFFNPKAGVQYRLGNRHFMYLTFGRSGREPVRSDFVDSDRNSRPEPEFMNNIETAFKSSISGLKYTVTGFYMGYRNQLVLTGKLNDVGGYTRTNIHKSYRTGIEIETSYQVVDWIRWDLNVSLSRNKIKKFTEFVDDYSTGEQKPFDHENTNLVLSPSRIIGSQLLLDFGKYIDVLYLTKYVSRQYLDNSQTLSRSLDPYLINDLILQFNTSYLNLKKIAISLMLNNIGNRIYASNGYSYSGIIDGERRDFSFVYPQAGTNFLLKFDLLF